MIATIISVLAILLAITATVFALAARRAAKAAAADTFRLDEITRRRLSLFAGETNTDWGVMAGTRLAASSADLRTAIDTALAEDGASNG